MKQKLRSGFSAAISFLIAPIIWEVFAFNALMRLSQNANWLGTLIIQPTTIGCDYLMIFIDSLGWHAITLGFFWAFFKDLLLFLFQKII